MCFKQLRTYVIIIQPKYKFFSTPFITKIAIAT